MYHGGTATHMDQGAILKFENQLLDFFLHIIP